MTKKNFVIIALGTNLGDKFGNLKRALELLKVSINIEKCSEIYGSQALLPEGAPKDWESDFYNCVFWGETSLDPQALLVFCNEIENKVSGKPREKGSWAPRYLDIDILAFNESAIHSKDLTIPHSKMQERGFVMFPLADILPDWVHPVFNMSANELADKLSKNQLNIKKLNLAS